MWYIPEQEVVYSGAVGFYGGAAVDCSHQTAFSAEHHPSPLEWFCGRGRHEHASRPGVTLWFHTMLLLEEPGGRAPLPPLPFCHPVRHSTRHALLQPCSSYRRSVPLPHLLSAIPPAPALAAWTTLVPPPDVVGSCMATGSTRCALRSSTDQCEDSQFTKASSEVRSSSIAEAQLTTPSTKRCAAQQISPVCPR
jgi:hypothetical protein